MWIFLDEKSTQRLRLRSTPFPKTLSRTGSCLFSVADTGNAPSHLPGARREGSCLLSARLQGKAPDAHAFIPISVCWVVSINWTGSWTFQQELPYRLLDRNQRCCTQRWWPPTLATEKSRKDGARSSGVQQSWFRSSRRGMPFSES